MKNTIENSAQAEAHIAGDMQSGTAQELFEPREWEGLLNSFEDGPPAPAPARNESEIELSSDDLWERLSSTRWLRDQNIERESTIAQRPMD